MSELALLLEEYLATRRALGNRLELPARLLKRFVVFAVQHETPFPRLLALFFTERLMRQRQASPHTIASYRTTFRLLIRYAQSVLNKPPSAMTLDDFDTALLGDFLSHLETERGNDPRTRNTRLAAIRSFFRFVALHEPRYAALAQRVLAIPDKRFTRPPVAYLDHDEDRGAAHGAGPREPASDAATAPCCSWRSKPDCGPRSLSACDARTFSSAPAPMCGVTARDERSGARPLRKDAARGATGVAEGTPRRSRATLSSPISAAVRSAMTLSTTS